MNNYLKILLTASGVITAGLFAASGKIFQFTFGRPNVNQGAQSSEELANAIHEKYRVPFAKGIDWIRSQEREQLTITSNDGLRLVADYLPAQDAERIAILCHGWHGTSYGDFSGIAQWYHEHQTSILLIDERAQSRSGGSYMTFGAKEKKDIALWAAYMDTHKNPDRLPMYLHGVSMGSASVMLASVEKLPDTIKGIIADCGYSSMEKQFSHSAHTMFHIPAFPPLMMLLDFWCRMLGGFAMKDADVTAALRKASLPFLFIHGTADDFVLPENSRINYAACAAPKELVWIQDSPHALACLEDPDTYQQKVAEFFAKYDN